VDRQTAIARLPAPYAIVLELHDQRRDDEMGAIVGADPEAVPRLLRLAEAKLARLMESRP
jgi:hypothetical protein